MGTKKRFKKLKGKVRKVTNSITKFSKKKIQKLKNKILKFINSRNKYEQAYKEEVRQLLVQLEKVSQVQLPKSDFLTGWVIAVEY